MRYVNVECKIGISNADIRTFAELLAKVIRYCIFYAVGNKLGVFEVFAVYYCIYGKAIGERHILFPFNAFTDFVNFVCRIGFKMLEGFENANSWRR